MQGVGVDRAEGYEWQLKDGGSHSDKRGKECAKI